MPIPSRQPRGRRAAWALIAAAVALALACLGGGYALGDHFGSNGSEVVRVVPLEGSGARASVSLEQRRARRQLADGADGHRACRSSRATAATTSSSSGATASPAIPCVGFKMAHGTTTVRFTVPYELKDDTELVVTAIEPGKASWPGKVVMRTA